MRLGIDIDDTITYTYPEWTLELRRRGYDVTDADWHPGNGFRGVSLGAVRDMYVEKREEFRRNYSVVEGAPAVINLLGHELIAMTGRLTDEDVCPHTVYWLRKHNIPISKIIHTQDKAAACKEHDIDLLIEDDPRYALPVLEAGIPVLLRNHHYNESLEHPLVTRFSHWLEVPLLLKRFENHEQS